MIIVLDSHDYSPNANAVAYEVRRRHKAFIYHSVCIRTTVMRLSRTMVMTYKDFSHGYRNWVDSSDWRPKDIAMVESWNLTTCAVENCRFDFISFWFLSARNKYFFME